MVLPGSEGQTSAWWIPDPTPPCLMVMGQDEIDYATGGFGSDDTEWDLIVLGLTGFVSARGAQERLDRWLASSGDESVKAALEADQTLGGTAYGVRVDRAAGSRLHGLQNRDEQVWGTEWTVHIETSG